MHVLVQGLCVNLPSNYLFLFLLNYKKGKTVWENLVSVLAMNTAVLIAQANLQVYGPITLEVR